jgi:signal peptidase
VTKFVSRLCNGLGTVILLLIILGAGGLVLSQFLGWQPMGILSGSMEPNYRVGGLVFINTKAVPEDIAAGDVVAFYIGEDAATVVTHRVIAVDWEAGTFTTQGDANNAADAPTSFERMIGRAGWHVPWAGYALMNLKTVKGFAAGAILLAVLILLFLIPALLTPAKETAGPKHARGGSGGQAWKNPPAEAPGADSAQGAAAGSIGTETRRTPPDTEAGTGGAGTAAAPEIEGVSPGGFPPRRGNNYTSE